VFDVLTTAAVADELAATLLDGRIQRIGLVDRLTVAAEVYAGGRRHALIASADNRSPRVHLAPAMPSLDAELVTPFGLLLRKYARGGVLVAVEQPPLERLLRLSIAKRLPTGQERRARRVAGEPQPEDDDPDLAAEEESEGEDSLPVTWVHLHVEIMGRHSNLILVDDDGVVMDSAKRVTTAMSRVRPVQPRTRYSPPPPLDRPDPRRLTASIAAQMVNEATPGAELARWLVASFRGISPQMGREIAFRCAGDAAAPVDALRNADGAAVLARETRALLEPLLTSAWAPKVYRDVGDKAPVTAYAAIPMAHLRATKAEEDVSSISFAVALAEGGPDGDDASPARHAQRRQRLLDAIGAARHRQERKLAAVRQQGAQAAEIERLRRWGALIYANLWQIEPGQRELVVEDEVVPLDPSLPAKETAAALFERYRKAQSAGTHQEEAEVTIAAELAHLADVATLVEHAAGFAELEALAAEWEAEAGAPAGKAGRKRQATRRPRPLLDADGNAVFVGHTAAQNEMVTFDIAGPNDTWLHARGVGGSHVVVRWNNPTGEEREGTILAAAALAAWYSAARNAGRVEVDVTRRRYVRKIKGGKPGMVTYRKERTIAVTPGDEGAVRHILTSGRGEKTR
jgi:predicted ribosome quality control (RQC) complex YloA/Tae2 family protein